MCQLTIRSVWQSRHSRISRVFCRILCSSQVMAVMSHIRMSHVTHMNESCHTYEGSISHVWMSHVKHMNESFHTYEWVMSHISTHMMCHIWTGHVTHINKSLCRYGYAQKSHTHPWKSHTYSQKSHTYLQKRPMSHKRPTNMRHIPALCVQRALDIRRK